LQRYFERHTPLTDRRNGGFCITKTQHHSIREVAQKMIPKQPDEIVQLQQRKSRWSAEK